MTWKKLVLLCGLLCVSSQSTAQERSSESSEIVIDEAIQKRLFEKTYWIPKRGVTLLKQKYAIKAWNRMREKPCFQNVMGSPVYGLVAFNNGPDSF